jgi:hypothetical protein
VQLSSGEYTTCGIDVHGKVHCWGDFVRAPPSTMTFLQVSCGDYHCCGVREDASLHCWGTDVAHLARTVARACDGLLAAPVSCRHEPRPAAGESRRSLRSGVNRSGEEQSSWLRAADAFNAGPNASE